MAEATDPQELPAGLRQRVLEASRAARAAGRAIGAAPEITASEAFSRSADAFYAVLCVLEDDDWQRAAIRDLTVQGLVGHLIGVERDLHRALAGDLDVADLDHVASTQDEALNQTGRPPRTTRADWREAADQTLALIAQLDLDIEVAIHTLRPSVGALLLVRAFELWTHENDIRSVCGLGRSEPDASTLRLMTNLAARALPLGADRIGLDEPTPVRLVLTGPSGGTWDVELGTGPAPAARPVRIIADAIDFCRLAANRVGIDQIELQVSGDPGRARQVLAAVAALALD